MRLRTQFFALIVLAAILGVASLAVLGPIVQSAKQLAAEERQVQIMAREGAGLLALTQQYVLFGGERAAQQWWMRHHALGLALKEHEALAKVGEQRPRLQEELNILADLFRTLVAASADRPDAPLSTKQREAVIEHIIVETQTVTEETYRWEAALAARRQTSEKSLITWAVALPAILSLMFAVGAALMAHQVLRPLRSLREAMDALAEGDLSARCNSTASNEVGELSRHFDHMGEQLESRTKALTLSEALTREALREKETLLKEVYHRVKNNLQVTQSLLSLQHRSMHEPAAREALDDSVQRVRAMALVHEKLYQSSNLSSIALPDYVYDLLRQVGEAAGASARGIRLHGDIQPIETGLDSAVPFGLLLTELISNGIKHAFPHHTGGEIHVMLRAVPDGMALNVKDDGVGLPPEFDLRTTESMGLQLAASLAAQLGGKLEVSREDRGTVFKAVLTRL